MKNNNLFNFMFSVKSTDDVPFTGYKSIEELYQAFKERLMDEVVAEATEKRTIAIDANHDGHEFYVKFLRLKQKPE